MPLADTDVLIDYLAGKGEAEEIDRLLRQGALRTTVITRFELLAGAKNPKQVGRVVQLLEAVPTFGLDDPSTYVASEIEKSLKLAGKAMGMADSLIAGIVIRNHGVLLTRNRSHFDRIPGLRLGESH